MAGFFDKVVGEINRGVNAVSEGSKNIVEKANLNNQIRDIEKDKSILLQNLGTLVYNMHARGEITIEQCVGMCGEVAARDKKIIELQEQLKALETAKAQTYAQTFVPTDIAGGVACECGAMNKEGAKFCAKCGKQM